MTPEQAHAMVDFLRDPPGAPGTQWGQIINVGVTTYFKGGQLPPRMVATHQIQVLGVNHSVLADLLKARDAVLKRKFLR